MKIGPFSIALAAFLAACGGGGGGDTPAPPPSTAVTPPVASPPPPPPPTPPTIAAEAKITEFHYENAGQDEGEFIEVRVATGADVSTISVELYDGATGTVYATLALSSVTPTTNAGYDYYIFELEADTLENGPDGLALIEGDVVVEFLSYEGAFEAIDGAAAGLLSIDIELFQSDSTPIGSSLQILDDGTWVLTSGGNTIGTANVTVRPPPQTTPTSPPPPPPPPTPQPGTRPPPPPPPPSSAAPGRESPTNSRAWRPPHLH